VLLIRVAGTGDIRQGLPDAPGGTTAYRCMTLRYAVVIDRLQGLVL
jgi:hypothetical protein